MILCTSYGLLIYECQITKISPASNSKQNEDEEAKKSAEDVDDDDKPKIALSANYKLSVLPDERVLDCLSF
eukprot:CAMPEP_0170456128 /NCGR_PEP_ID=MMETSP0123-20130129/3868_1 /TAXON_ID=182087 /ORGANISM="Favella ehrenbergii, Strain Fehren 1" /LENGTH=70 /DNA_ID=CAMNT_0010719507 /DNA_START=206 /DNA_END=418 /DNA_ORIENTATION=+